MYCSWPLMSRQILPPLNCSLRCSATAGVGAALLEPRFFCAHKVTCPVLRFSKFRKVRLLCLLVSRKVIKRQPGKFQMEVKTNLVFIFLYPGLFSYDICHCCGPTACVLFKVMLPVKMERMNSKCMQRYNAKYI